jgi:phage tail protein X
MDFIRSRTVFGDQINHLAWDEYADHLQVGFLDSLKKPRPGLGVMGPSEPSGFMRFPLRGKTVGRPINPEGGG